MEITFKYNFQQDSLNSHLKSVCKPVQELDDKERGDLSLRNWEEEEFASVDRDEVVVWGLEHRGHILGFPRLLFGL